jgi:two-component system cell cycle sensor histidine kinase/response regulator CckA
MVKDILLIDDDIETRDMLAKFIERRGIKVYKAASGREGIELYGSTHPACVFLDVHMPDMDGISVFGEIKKVHPDARIYFVTGSTDSYYFQEKVKELGASGYFPKPLILDDVVEAINKIEDKSN